MYELREEVFKFSKEGGKCGDWVISDLWTVIDNIPIGAQLLGLLWGLWKWGRWGVSTVCCLVSMTGGFLCGILPLMIL